ncbi:DUF3426 domain-containing protein [Ramlibacter solisilvae]|uniref:Zinc finger/thioredoxin putative domain-containing protein n=1 Tax=Ramlibacter tataouinensis TaxID=94132 RepID=A0A127JQB0_9BURK|nr:DUF3426 domain-containing protein [Ramlibacter tataouinensis]AMO22218.1 hypothetical protein UC35_04090 [Ramlibacter tataouinensis]
MSLITRCPACGTMFKVVADQLKVSDGWVRCGHCAEVFDATGNLQDEDAVHGPAAPGAALNEAPEPQAPASAPEPEPQPQPAATISKPPVDGPIFDPVPDDTAPATTPLPEAAAHDDDFPTSIHSQVDDSEIEGFANSRELDDAAQVLRADPRDRPFALRRADPMESHDIGPHGLSRPTPLEDPELHDLSFVRQARRKAFWRRPVVRFGLLLLALALAALLALQVAWHERDRLAAAEPALRPWLQKMCEAAGCKLGPPRRIEAVAIDNSSFNKLRGDAYRLNITLKNRADTEVAMPALELTLTDSQDQAVLRRVLTAAEFAGSTTTLLPRAEWSTTLALGVAGSSASRIAGYRVLAFYP